MRDFKMPHRGKLLGRWGSAVRVVSQRSDSPAPEPSAPVAVEVRLVVDADAVDKMFPNPIVRALFRRRVDALVLRASGDLARLVRGAVPGDEEPGEG